MSIAITNQPLPLASTDDVGITSPPLKLPVRLVLNVHSAALRWEHQFFDASGKKLFAVSSPVPWADDEAHRKVKAMAEYIRDAINATVDVVG